jgi:hypothetical protein
MTKIDFGDRLSLFQQDPEALDPRLSLEVLWSFDAVPCSAGRSEPPQSKGAGHRQRQRRQRLTTQLNSTPGTTSITDSDFSEVMVPLM